MSILNLCKPLNLTKMKKMSPYNTVWKCVPCRHIDMMKELPKKFCFNLKLNAIKKLLNFNNTMNGRKFLFHGGGTFSSADYVEFDLEVH